MFLVHLWKNDLTISSDDHLGWQFRIDNLPVPTFSRSLLARCEQGSTHLYHSGFLSFTTPLICAPFNFCAPRKKTFCAPLIFAHFNIHVSQVGENLRNEKIKGKGPSIKDVR